MSQSTSCEPVDFRRMKSSGSSSLFDRVIQTCGEATFGHHAFLTFQNTGEEPLTIPEMLSRQALGVNHWPVGM